MFEVGTSYTIVFRDFGYLTGVSEVVELDVVCGEVNGALVKFTPLALTTGEPTGLLEGDQDLRSMASGIIFNVASSYFHYARLYTGPTENS